jgi:hypothetical protein
MNTVSDAWNVLRRRVPWSLQKQRRRQWRELLRQHPQSVLWFVPWLLSQRASRSPLGDGVPWIPFVARRWLDEQLSASSRVFEWGSGGSTLLFARRAFEVVSVEHDKDWHRLVRESLDRQQISNCSYRLVPPEAVPSAVSSPFRSGRAGAEDLTFEAYVKAILDYPDGHFDLIMIDGRARVACLEAAWPKVRVGGHILLDNSNQPRYQAALVARDGFDQFQFAGVSPYRGDVWTQSTIWRRTPDKRTP